MTLPLFLLWMLLHASSSPTFWSFFCFLKCSTLWSHNHKHTHTLSKTHMIAKQSKAREEKQDRLRVWVRVERDDSYGFVFSPFFSLGKGIHLEQTAAHTQTDIYNFCFLMRALSRCNKGGTGRKSGLRSILEWTCPFLCKFLSHFTMEVSVGLTSVSVWTCIWMCHVSQNNFDSVMLYCVVKVTLLLPFPFNKVY